MGFRLAQGISKLAHLGGRAIWKIYAFGMRLCFQQCGRLRCNGIVRVVNGHRIRLGKDVSLDRELSLAAGPEGLIIVGNHVNFGHHTEISANLRVEIQDDVLIAPHCFIIDSNHAYSRRDLTVRAQGVESAPVLIRTGAWLSQGVVVLSGVTIGEGAVIGAKAVVTKDVPPFAVAVGVPARVVGYRQ